MRFTHFLGIDISKEKVDMCLFDGEELLGSIEVMNGPSELKQAFQGLIKSHKLNHETLLVCAEYTGMYVNPVILTSQGLGLNLWLEDPATIKWSSGVQRGKNDKVDAERIAVYAFRFVDKAKLFEAQEATLEELKYLDSERELLVKDRAKYSAQIKDQPRFLPKKVFEAKNRRLLKLIKTLSKAIMEIDSQIDHLIKEDDLLRQQFDIIISIKGVGKQLATSMIITTKGFSKYPDARKFCCYAGVAPFVYTSGSSQRSKSKVSNRANKKVKYLLHMAALSSIQNNPEIKEYYNRKVNEGKNKMTILNAIRAKLVHRIFALVRDVREYEAFYTSQFV